MNLYDITTEYAWLMNEEALTDELKEKLNELEQSFDEKCLYLGKIIKNIESDITLLELEIDHLQERLNRKKKKMNDLMDYIKANMMIVKKDKLSYPLFDIKLKRNPCKVMIEPGTELPDEYVKEKLTTVINKDLIRNHLKEGVFINGCMLVHETRLEIA